MILLSAKLFFELSSLTTSSVYSFTTMLGNSVRFQNYVLLLLEKAIHKIKLKMVNTPFMFVLLL